MSRRYALLVFMLITVQAGWSQVEENLKRYANDNGKGYIQPLVSGLGAAMNRGWYSTARIPALGLRLQLGVVAMAAPVQDRDKTFTATTEGLFYPPQEAKVSTVVGKEKAEVAVGSGGSLYYFPGGLNMNVTAVAVPQLTIGSIMGTELTARYIAADLGDSDMGQLELVGVGVRHSVSQYIPLFPVDVSVGAFWQNIKVKEDMLVFTNLHYGFQASKRIGMLTAYGGIGYDKSAAAVKYEYSGEDEPVILDYDLTGDDGLQMTVGLGLNMLVVHLSGDYTFGQRQAFSLTAAVGL